MMEDNINIVKFLDPFTILAINSRGHLRRIYVPFRVQCIQPAGQIPKDAWVFVDAVWETKQDRLLNLVGGKLFPHSFFLGCLSCSDQVVSNPGWLCLRMGAFFTPNKPFL